MADIRFRISTGPYAGAYNIDLADITANDVGDLLAQGGPDLDDILVGAGSKGTRAFAAFVWVVRRRGSKGLSYRAVAEHVSIANVEPADDLEAAPAPDTVGLLDPSNSAAT